MNFSQLFNILRARSVVIVGALVLTTLVGFVVSILLPKQYTASAAVLVDKSIDPVAGTVSASALLPGYLTTQVDIINSTRVASRAVVLLHMDQDEDLRRIWMENEKGKGDFVTWAAGGLRYKLDAKPSRDSNVVQIAYTGVDPDFVAKVANAFAQAYVETDLALKIEPARQYSVWFEEQTKQARQKVEQAQKALSAYQQSSGIVVYDERLDYENSKLGELSSQLTQLQGSLAESRSKRASESVSTTNEAMQSRSVGELKADIAKLDAKLQENNENLGRNHPQTLRAQAELASLRRQLSRELGQIATSFDTSFKIDKQREQQLMAAMDAQKLKVLELNRQRNEFNVLRRDVESAQRDYDAVGQRLAQTRLESRSSQTNVSILSPATPPASPSKPKVLLNTLAAAVVGLTLGLAFALVLELTNRRIRSTHDLGIALDLPVLASIGEVKLLQGRTKRPRGMLGHNPIAT